MEVKGKSCGQVTKESAPMTYPLCCLYHFWQHNRRAAINAINEEKAMFDAALRKVSTNDEEV